MFTKVILICLSLNQIAQSIKIVSDDALISIIQENKDLLILFAKKDCVEDCKYEKNLIKLEEDFEATFAGSRVVKAEDSQLLRLYNPIKKNTQSNTLVFLRQTVPILYPSSYPDNAEEIFSFFNENRDPIVRELDDTNFESLTQASTGSTTGNWLVLFYDNSCVECTRMSAIGEAVAGILKFSYTNVARVNIGAKGVQTAKRFKVEKVPTFILLRKGKLYRYNLMNYEIESLVGFATKTFQNFGAEGIKPQASPFENLVENIVVKLKQIEPDVREVVFAAINDYPLLVLSIASVVMIYVLMKLFKKPSSEKKKEESSDKPVKKSSVKKDK